MDSKIKDMVLTTHEELVQTAESARKPNHPPSFNGGEGYNVVLSYDTFFGLGGDEEEEEGPSDSKEKEDHKDDDMAYQDLDWMTQGPLSLLGVLHKMSRHLENILTKYNPNKAVKS